MKDYAIHTDLYQINMGYTYFKENIHEKMAVFEVYFRDLPFNNGYAVFVGLQRIVEVIENLEFSSEHIEYLKQFDYSSEYLEYLQNFKFSGDIKSVKEGEIVFANEPLLIIEAKLIEAQLIETIILNIVNYQTLIATKASRIKQLLMDRTVIEFGARRAQEIDAALWGARAAYIALFDGSSLVEAGYKFDIPLYGTHAHSLVQAYESEYEAFYSYAKAHHNVSFLIDTYDAINIGIYNAIKVADELKDEISFDSVRIDSGDLAYTSKKIREILDEHGYQDVKIIASNDLDEEIIASLLLQGAKIDIFGVGTKLITGYDQPSLGAVYKMVHFDNQDVIKISNNIEKITTPGKKEVYRVLNVYNKSEGDLIVLENEEFHDDLLMFDEKNPLISKRVTNYQLKNLHVQLYKGGHLIYNLPSIDEIRAYHQEALSYIWDETLRLKNPAKYYVDLSSKCFANKQKLIKKYSTK